MFNYSITTLTSYLDNVSIKKIRLDEATLRDYVIKASKHYDELFDAVYIYENKINQFLFEIFDMDISALRLSDKKQREEQKKWYGEIKDIESHTVQLINKTAEESHG